MRSSPLFLCSLLRYLHGTDKHLAETFNFGDAANCTTLTCPASNNDGGMIDPKQLDANPWGAPPPALKVHNGMTQKQNAEQTLTVRLRRCGVEVPTRHSARPLAKIAEPKFHELSKLRQMEGCHNMYSTFCLGRQILVTDLLKLLKPTPWECH